MRVRGTWARFWFVLLFALLLLAGVGCGGDGDEEFRLVFYSERDGDSDIYLMDADGSNVQQLTNEAGSDYEAKASPDGSLIVFGSQRAGGENGLLYVMNVDGSGVRPLTTANEGQAVNDEYPDWSPDGRRVAFQRVTSLAEGAKSDLWLVDIESGRETQLTDTPDVWDSTPSFAADGNSVLFENSSSGDFEIYQLRLDDMRVSQLTDSEGTEIEAKQSPDGARIAFAFERDGDFDIYVMSNDGSDLRALTDNDAADGCPQWSPDGKRISFVSERDGDMEIYLMNSDGSDQRRLTNSPGTDEVPDWVALP